MSDNRFNFGHLRQIPGTMGANVNAWKFKGKEIAYVIKNVPCMVQVWRLDPNEPDKEITACVQTYSEWLGEQGKFKLTVRKQDCLAIYSEEERGYIEAMNAHALSSGMLRIITIEEMDRLDGTVFSVESHPVTGDL